MMIKRVMVVLVLATASVAFADSRIVSPRGASLEALTAALQQGHGGNDLAAVAAERQSRLSALVKTDVAAVLREALSGPARSSLPPRVRDFVEERIEFEGALEVLVEDREDGSRMFFNLETDSGDRYALYFLSQPTNLLTGERVRVSGLRVDNVIAIGSDQAAIRRIDGATTSSVEAATAVSNTFGQQKTLVLLVNFSNNPVQPYSIAQARNVVFTTTSNFDLENSYGQTWLTGDVFGWFTIPMTNTVCDPTLLGIQAQSAAMQAGVNLSAYDRYVYAFPGNACGFWGLGSIGGRPSQAWINGSLSLTVLGHEMGHNLGLFHAHSLDCGSVVLGTTCTMSEYGDTVDIMALPSYDFNAFQKERLGWLNYGASPPLTTVTTSGTYGIGPMETLGTESKALKIPRGATGSFFYVELRRGLGFDAGLAGNANISNGVIVHLASPSDPDSSNLLDMTAATPSFGDPALTVGQNFTDSASGVSITVNSVSAAGASVTVALSGTPPPPPPSCTHAVPTVSLVPSQTTGVAAGTTLSFTLSVTNRDVSPCTTSVFNIASSVPSGWTGALTAASLTVAPGASASTTLKVTSPTSAANGTYAVSSSATNSGAATASASASASYAVSNPPPPPPGCTHVAPAVTLVSSQSVGVAAGTAVSFTLSVTNKDVSPCTGSVFKLASIVPSGWTGALAASVSAAPGAIASATLTATSPTSAANGSYTVTASATNSTAVTATASASGTYLVNNPPVGGTVGSFFDDFNRPDSSSLGTSWTGVSGGLVVAGNMTKSAPGASGNHVALLSNLSGAAETAEADFTSVDNNLGPRFGIILRYKDSKNYYQIYRQTGGSSRLLVSKFVNGVETILGMASIANPTKGVAFHIKGQVAGSTLTLDFDGVRKVTTYDSTFSAGKVGILIGNASGTTQQQADNYRATVQ